MLIFQQKGNTDPAQSGYWSVRESFVSFVLTNLPMVYPLMKRVVEKTVSASKSGTNKTSGLGDSQGYKLEDYRNKVHSKSRPDETELGDTVWGSKDHIVTNDGQVSADDASLRSGDKVHRGSHANMRSENVAQAVGGQPAGHQHAWGVGTGTGEIMVTKEYVVQVDEEAAKPKASYSKRF